MKNRLVNMMLAGLLLFLTACVRPQEKMQKDIAGAEALMNADTALVPNFHRADSLIKMYLLYADQYQDDTLSPDYLFKAGELCVGVGRFDQAMDHFGRVQRYPNYKRVASALFMQGFVAENHLHNTDKAKECYEKFLKLYPDHALAGDARILLSQLSISPEDLVKMFEQQNVAGGMGDSTAANN